MGRLLAAALLVLAAAAPAAGSTTFCVKPGGGGACTSTINAALALAQPGDTIRVAAGTYVESILVNKTLTLEGGWNLTFTARNPAANVTTIMPSDPSFSVVDIEGNFADTSAVAPTLDGFTITGALGGNHGGGLRVRDSNALIRRNVITGNTAFLLGGGVWVQRGAPRFEANRIENNTVSTSGALGGGVHLEGTQASMLGNVVAHNHLQDVGSAGGGIAVQGGPVALLNNTFDANDDAAVDFDSNLTLTNNIITNHTLGVRRQITGVLTESVNDFWMNTANASGFVLDPTDLLVNPLLTLSDHLMAASPMIDAGARVVSSDLDIDGESRVMAGTSGFYRVDIGADELTGAAQRLVNLDTGRADLTIIGPGGTSGSPTDGNQDNIGESVLVGDVNGDGKADLVAAAMEWADDPDNPPRTAGRLFGLSNFGTRVTGVIDLLSTAPALTLKCTLNVQHIGAALVNANVSGDASGDLIVGSSRNDGATDGSGLPTVFVFRGGASLAGTLTLSALTGPGSADFTLRAPAMDLEAFAIKNALAAGDISGDSVADILVGDPLANHALVLGTGAVFIIDGGSGLTGTRDLATTAADYTVYGATAGAGLGPFALGRVNAGSQVDLVARTSTTAYVFLGPLAGPTGTSVTTASANVTITGLSAPLDSKGSVIVGDLTGDGQDDVILASGDDLYVIPGPLSSGTIAVASAATLVLTGAKAAVLRFGDILGDAKPDLIVGRAAAPQAAYVIHGGITTLGSHPIADLADVVVEGPAGAFQFYDASTGDLDLDGRADLAIGAYPVSALSHAANFQDAGKVFVIYGEPCTPPAVTAPAPLTVTQTLCQ